MADARSMQYTIRSGAREQKEEVIKLRPFYQLGQYKIRFPYSHYEHSKKIVLLGSKTI